MTSVVGSPRRRQRASVGVPRVHREPAGFDLAALAHQTAINQQNSSVDSLSPLEGLLGVGVVGVHTKDFQGTPRGGPEGGARSG